MSLRDDLPAICLGGNTFGWTSDEAESRDVLDAAHDAGLTFIDTADVYSAWAHDGQGGQSETILGRWISDRGCRNDVTIATKVGMHPGLDDIRPETISAALTGSLERLQTDRIDLYYAHKDDGGDLEETLRTFADLQDRGAIGAYGLSNFSAARLREALETCEREGLPTPAALQPEWSLVSREIELDLVPVAQAARLLIAPHSSLASGFLTGKYRPGADVDSARAGGMGKWLGDAAALSVLGALDRVAEATGAEHATIALAWLMRQGPSVAPIASARTVEQVEPLRAALTLELDAAQLRDLDDASTALRAAATS